MSLLAAARHDNDMPAVIAAVLVRPDWVLATNPGHWLEASVGTSNRVVVTGLEIVPQALPMHYNPTKALFGAGGGEAIPIPPSALAGSCNVYYGSSAASVAGTAVLANTYIRGLSCGIGTLILTDAYGCLRARFGIADGSSPGPLALQIAVPDQTSHPLFQATVHAAAGLLYDMRLAGAATVCSQVYPPVESPVLVPGGMAISANELVRQYNSYMADADVLLIHEATLEQWALRGVG